MTDQTGAGFVRDERQDGPGEREDAGPHRGDKAPGEHHRMSVADSIRSYLIGLGLAALLTAGSFGLTYSHLVYGPGVQVALVVFAIAQMGIHLVFFLHLTTSADNINNAMALAFGVLIVFLLMAGTLWIMYNMNHNMMPAPGMTGGMQMQP